MKFRGLYSAFILVSTILCFPLATASNAMTSVEAGYDLFQTQPGTSMNTGLLTPPLPLGTILFEGVPLETFDFGGTTGVQSTGNADTIVERKTPATVSTTPGSDTIDIEIVALQLKSVSPVDLTPLDPSFGLPSSAELFITLQTRRLPGEADPGAPSNANKGEMTINFADENGGTFSSFFDLFFDIRLNAVDGGIIFSADKRFETAGTEWNRLPEPGDILIDGVNHFLLGLNDPTGDFFPEPLTEFIPSNEEGTVHKVSAATVPEPATLWMLMAGLLGFCATRRRQDTPALGSHVSG
jgi:hypothetical protein